MHEWLKWKYLVVLILRHKFWHIFKHALHTTVVKKPVLQLQLSSPYLKSMVSQETHISPSFLMSHLSQTPYNFDVLSTKLNKLDEPLGHCLKILSKTAA